VTKSLPSFVTQTWVPSDEMPKAEGSVPTPMVWTTEPFESLNSVTTPYRYRRWPSVSTWGKTMGQKARMELILDCAEPKRLARFWLEALDYRNYYTDTNLAVLIPKEGTASPLLLQGVPEAKACKNRMHLDIVVDDIEVEVHRLEALGAHRIDKEAQRFGGTRLVRMSDPEQNEFCVSTGVDWLGAA
jgi:predicted enzyme related to lactoylglutathione lyase